MFKGVCEEINIMGKYIVVKQKDSGVDIEFDDKLNDYCPNKNNGINGQCETNDEKISAGFIWLLVMFEHLCDEGCPQNEKDQYVEYAILWLSYMLNQISNEGISTLKDFYTNNIEKNTKYTRHVTSVRDNNHKEIVYKKINLMNMNKNIISKFYDVFKSLCSMYNELDEDEPNYPKCFQSAQNFVAEYQKFLNDNDVDTNGSSYKQILPILSNVYDDFKKKCNNAQYSNFPPLPTTKTTQNVVEISEATSSSSSIASKLIPVLLISSIPILLGIAYKVNNKEFINIIFKIYFRDSLYVIIKKYIISLPFLF
ncbi:Plasmodium variant antigen protein Cir/Yir/Bir, putative [Plasmodium chabaudi chabaudi]|uniref:Plasmodium variant antigen protein Cir/Yir/Bir, putative n=1 Tax=Plasmodium chabaudi chabaudi TaxID=31271 RepID=A0A1D3L861_PLACU|nr:Plasmodium variant antigen protein Cir/Yir/Bir, putative [Plasmodium chabaudi chabaudi]